MAPPESQQRGDMNMDAGNTFEREITILDSIDEGILTADRPWRIITFHWAADGRGLRRQDCILHF